MWASWPINNLKQPHSQCDTAETQVTTDTHAASVTKNSGQRQRQKTNAPVEDMSGNWSLSDFLVEFVCGRVWHILQASTYSFQSPAGPLSRGGWGLDIFAHLYTSSPLYCCRVLVPVTKAGGELKDALIRALKELDLLVDGASRLNKHNCHIPSLWLPRGSAGLCLGVSVTAYYIMLTLLNIMWFLECIYCSSNLSWTIDSFWETCINNKMKEISFGFFGFRVLILCIASLWQRFRSYLSH